MQRTKPLRDVERFYPKVDTLRNRYGSDNNHHEYNNSRMDRCFQPIDGSCNRVEHSPRRKGSPSSDERIRPPGKEYGPESLVGQSSDSKAVTPEPVKRMISNQKLKTTRRVGGGAFGDIYICVSESGEKLAVKFERHGTRNPQLRHEYKVIRSLQDAPGFAKVHYFGTQDSYDLLIMDLLGPSLEDHFNSCGRRFSLKTVLMIADQMLKRVESMHSRHLIHRDIKPANFVTDRGNEATIYCIDFGLSKVYRHPRTLQHIPEGSASLTGTPRYASINAHLNTQQSRRDDLESIAYVLFYFLLGRLPWQGLGGEGREKYRRIMMCKQKTPVFSGLCKGLPREFGHFLAYARDLGFDEKPNYAGLRDMFYQLFLSLGYTASDHKKLNWDWNQAEHA